MQYILSPTMQVSDSGLSRYLARFGYADKSDGISCSSPSFAHSANVAVVRTSDAKMSGSESLEAHSWNFWL